MNEETCTEKLYPSLDYIDVTEEEITGAKQQAKEEAKEQAKQDYFKRFIRDKQQQLNEKLSHYNKLKHRWTIIKHVSEGIGMVTTTICAVLTVVATTGVLAAPILAVSTASTGLLSPILSTLTNKTFIAKHRNSIKEKSRRTKEVLDKLYLSFSRATSDGVITPEEMNQIEKILRATTQSTAPPFLNENQQELLKNLLEAAMRPH